LLTGDGVTDGDRRKDDIRVKIFFKQNNGATNRTCLFSWHRQSSGAAHLRHAAQHQYRAHAPANVANLGSRRAAALCHRAAGIAKRRLASSRVYIA
jgi:hypothetical protein